MSTKNDDFTPFPTVKYIGPEYFCDRQDELATLRSAVSNDRPITIFSMRRMGKTGLIKHLHHHLTKSRKYICIYVDVFNTTSDTEFANKLVSTVLAALHKSKKNFLSEMLTTFGQFRPKVTMDPLTGAPALELDIQEASEVKMSLQMLFGLLATQKKKIQIAIDEFQQIANYKQPSKMAATIREYMQSTGNTHFLFCGSQRHLLLDLFNSPKQPLYRMVDQMHLHEVGFGKYQQFIIKQFANHERTIEEHTVHQLLHWTRQHTFYVQVLCNKLFAIPKQSIGERDLKLIQQTILKEQEMNFLGFKRLLTTNQYRTLRGIAISGSVKSVRTRQFTQQFEIAASTAQQSLTHLLDTEMVYEMLSEEGSEYIVYDLFLHRWLAEVSRP